MVERHKKHKKASRHAYSSSAQEQVFRVRLPRGKEVIGVVEQRLGMGKSRIRCTDSKVRICRVPGAKKRRLWVRPEDIVIVEPWEFGGDTKGDIIYKYKKTETNWLRDRGHLKDLLDQDEF